MSKKEHVARRRAAVGAASTHIRRATRGMSDATRGTSDASAAIGHLAAEGHPGEDEARAKEAGERLGAVTSLDNELEAAVAMADAQDAKTKVALMELQQIKAKTMFKCARPARTPSPEAFLTRRAIFLKPVRRTAAKRRHSGAKGQPSVPCKCMFYIYLDLTRRESPRPRASRPAASRSMVDDVKTTHGTKKLLYLTNLQASVFTTGVHVERLLAGLEVPEPKLVIKLIHSVSGVSWVESKPAEERMPRRDWTQVGNPPGVTSFGGIVDLEEAVCQERELELFLEETLIPIAAESQALVLLDLNLDCTLSSCFTRAVRNVRSRYGDVLPFSIIGVTTAVSMYLASVEDNGNIACQLARGSNHWRERLPTIKPAVHAGYPVEYMNDAVSHYIIVEAVNDTVVPHVEEHGPRVSFEHLVLNHLVATLPSIAIRTTRSNRRFPATQIVSMLNMNVPVLALDLRARPGPDAFASVSTRSARLEVAIARWEETCESFYENYATECYDNCTLAYFYNMLYGDRDAHTTMQKMSGKVEAKGCGGGGVWLYKRIDSFKRKDIVLNIDDGGKDSASFPTDAHIRRICDVMIAKDRRDIYFTFDDAERAKFCPDGDAAAVAFLPQYRDMLRERWNAYYHILRSESFHGANIADTAGISLLISNLVKKDRLPDENTAQGLELLREAWCVVDVCMHVSGRYKIMAKTSFVLSILVTIVITLVTVLRSELEAEMDPMSEKPGPDFLLFLLSLALTMLGSVTAFYNPSHRWRRLRGMAMTMEAYIWQYRTRTDRFKQESGRSRQPDLALQRTIASVREEVLASGDVSHTAWSKTYPLGIFNHGQFGPPPKCGGDRRRGRGHGGGGGFFRVAPVPDGGGGPRLVESVEEDDHFSPLNPDSYATLRIQRQVEFYRSRLPHYERTHSLCQLTLILATSLGAFITFIGLSRFVAVVSVAAAGLTAWLEFHNTANKLHRYNRSVCALNNLTTWWGSLSDIERAGLGTINRFVLTGEGIVAGELAAWMSVPDNQGDGDDKMGVGDGRGGGKGAGGEVKGSHGGVGGVGKGNKGGGGAETN